MTKLDWTLGFYDDPAYAFGAPAPMPRLPFAPPLRPATLDYEPYIEYMREALPQGHVPVPNHQMLMVPGEPDAKVWVSLIDPSVDAMRISFWK